MKRMAWTHRDLLIVALVAVGTFGVALWIGLFGYVHEFVAQYRGGRLDELVPACMAAALAGVVALGWLAMRRQREAEIEARRDAEEGMRAARQARKDFAIRLSHEIRTSLNGAIGSTELVLDTSLSVEQRDLLEIARASYNRLLTVINDAVDFSEVEARKLERKPIDFGLRDCVGDTLEALAVPAHEKSLELAYSISDDVPDELVGDPTGLRKVIVSLVENAIAFTPAGGEVVVTIEAVSSSDRETRLRCTVRDTGVGIPPERHARVFDDLPQADASTMPAIGSTGLGLPICARIVHLMDGEIGVDSVVGKGSTFHFTASFGRQPGPHLAELPARPTALRGVSVLVVDDNPTNRRILETMLRGWAMEPTVVADGEAALCAMRDAAGRERPFRLVILDGRMPGLDGFGVAAEIQDDPNLAGATMLMLTSDRGMDDLARCRALGVNGYLVKPIKQPDLLQAIWDMLSTTAGSPRRARASDAASLRPLQVLLAEDNELNRPVMVRLLERNGHHVTVAANGEEVLARLAEATFDVILMDIEMPGMDGLEATAAIRRSERSADHPELKHIPIVALTACAMSGDKERFLGAGMDAYISKPVDAVHLFQTIATLVLDAKVRDDAQDPPMRLAHRA